MAKDKERAINPAAAQRKLEKQKALKKGKATLAAQRTERLAHRNPSRLQHQIATLQATTSSGGPLAPHDKLLLADLERDLDRVRKARHTLGVPEPNTHTRRGDTHTRGPGRGGVLGKRSRDDGSGHSSGSGSETDDSVRGIPMPRDTPPPVPGPDRRGGKRAWAENADLEPLGGGGGGAERDVRALPPAQTVYEAKAAVRDLRREAVRRFVPGVVARRLEGRRGRGGGGGLGAGELEGRERGGDMGSGGGGGGGEVAGVGVEAAPGVVGSPGEVGNRGDGGGELEGEEDRFERELRELGESTESRGVEMEEVGDEDL